MSKVFLTGDRGSVGKALTVQLESLGHTIVRSENAKFRIEDKNYFDSIPNPESIDVLYHLAAKSFVPESWANPPAFIQANVLGTANVLDFCKKYEIRLVYISSYAYGIPQYLPIDEKHPLSAVNPYGLSKLMGEELCEFYGKNYNLKYTIVRPFNIYGTDGNPALIIPEIISQIQKGESIKVRDLAPKRDYVFIDDVVSFLVLLLQETSNEVYNIGSGKGISVADLIATCQSVFKTNLQVISDETVRQNEIPETRCDFTKAKTDFGWEPRFSIEQGIKAIQERYY